MKYSVGFALAFLPALLLAQGSAEGPIAALIEQLGSGNSAKRHAATEALKARPEAAPALRKALGSADLETARRAALILEYYDGRPLRELEAAVKDGDAERLAKLVGEWPQGKNEAEVYSAIRDFVRQLADLHRKKGGFTPVNVNGKQITTRTGLDVAGLDGPSLPEVVSSPRITESTAARMPKTFFLLRAGEVDIDEARLKPGLRTELSQSEIIVASGKVRTRTHSTRIIIAGGDVEVYDGGNVIVSCGDVTVSGAGFHSLIIAKGKVTCVGPMISCRVISGKSVERDKMRMHGCVISENEPNPLGYVRFGAASAPPAK